MPPELQTARTLYFVSFITNIVFAVGWFFYIFLLGIGTCGFGCLFIFIPIINVVSAVYDFMAYQRLSSLNYPQTFSTLQTAAILEIVSILTVNALSHVFGIITLIQINKEEVKTFLKEKGIY